MAAAPAPPPPGGGGFTYERFHGTTGVHHTLQPTPLTLAFFSDQNLQIVQNALRRQVHERTQTLVPEQNPLELSKVFRHVFFNHAKHLPHDIPNQIAELNAHVVRFAVDNVVGNLRAQAHYVAGLERYPIPLDRPSPVRDFHNRAIVNTRAGATVG